MPFAYRLPRRLLGETFAHFRACGGGERECQTLWVSAWETPEIITEVVHPKHAAHSGGFELDDTWLNIFWIELARSKSGIRVQVHTHPGGAFHSAIDDDFPIVHTPGFLSLVIPRFAVGPIGFEGAYLTEIQEDGRWCQVAVDQRLTLI